jgi:hypothetical protein
LGFKVRVQRGLRLWSGAAAVLRLSFALVFS